MRTGVATWDEALLLFLERSGYVEETYHTFSYSPLTDDDGRIAGMLCVVSEDTERVIGERRMATLRDLGSGATTLTEEEVLAARRAAPGRQRRTTSRSRSSTCSTTTDGAARLAALHRGPGRAPRRGAPRRGRWRRSPREPTELVELERSTACRPAPWDEPPVDALVAPAAPAGPGPAVRVPGRRPQPLPPARRRLPRVPRARRRARSRPGIASARAYEAERRRAEALAELDRAKTAFFTNVSHEFRTPLTLLLGPAEDALADAAAPLADPQRRRVEVINRNAQRLLKLVNTLLDFSRLESGRVEAHFEPVDLAALHGRAGEHVRVRGRAGGAARSRSTARRSPSPCSSIARCGRRSCSTCSRTR